MVMEKLRRLEAKIYLKLMPIQDTYSLLKRFQVKVGQEELEQLEHLDQKWDKLKAQSVKTMEVLQSVAPSMKGRLINDIEDFKREVKRFKLDVRIAIFCVKNNFFDLFHIVRFQRPRSAQFGTTCSKRTPGLLQGIV